MKIRTSLFLTLAALTSWSAAAMDTFDTDGDGIHDNIDNCTLTYNQDQRDTDGDFFGNMCDADFNGDKVINFADLSYLGDKFLTTDEHADLNGDGVVNFIDIAQFGAMFLATPGPTATDPNQPPCVCYFSGDCPSGTFCNYGPGSWSTEDICVWRDEKPFGVPGAGCFIESDLTTGGWTPDICDGVCTSQNQGSPVGLEDTRVVAQAIQFWGDAMINPSAAGGGPVDAALAAAAQALQFKAPDVPIMLGRYTADALAISAGEPFHDFFCHYEGHPDDANQLIVDLSDNACRVAAGQITIRALVSELTTPGSAKLIMGEIPNSCPNWQSLFVSQCDVGPNALNCATAYVQSMAMFLRTPPAAAEGADLVLELLGSSGR